MTTAPETASDCSRCFGLCCVALPFGRSTDFPVDKPAGMPCGHLGPGHSCGIHDSLLDAGYRGCTVFECFGAGQQVSQVTFLGRSWRDAPQTAASMFAVFPVMHALHEMLRHVEEALGWRLPSAPRSDLETLHEELVGATAGGPDQLLALDLGALRARVGPALGAASEVVRSGVEHAGVERPAGRADRRLGRRADLAGADLRGI
ncbi:MAG: pentapeptide repeat-containing protein, partial [Lapillicoccus sp.]